MKNFLKFILAFFSVLVLAVLSANIGRLVYGAFFPRELGEGFFELFTPGIIEGFVFVYLFWLALIFVPVFKDKWWKYLLAPVLIIFVPFMFFWQIALFGIIFFAVGVALGYFALWLKKKM
jgi:hypothetical protein